jgi:uncharacterized protein YkwD
MPRLSWAKAFALVVTVLMVAPMPAAASTADTVLASINAARAKAGCQPLRLDSRLMAAAKSHARAMAEQNFFGHAGKDGNRFPARLQRQGYAYRTAAENIAAGQKSAGAVVKSWMQSAGHRRNILNSPTTSPCAAAAIRCGITGFRSSPRPSRQNPRLQTEFLS